MATVPDAPTKVKTESVPLLQDGDRLSRAEFERRYTAMPDLKKAELIDGVVYMPSPVSFGNHAAPHSDLMGWLGLYRTFTPGVRSADNATVRLDSNSEPQPDACLIILPSHGGRVTIDQDDYIAGGPEFIAEVAASTTVRDTTLKLRKYMLSGVEEYLVWRVFDNAFDWHRLRGSDYELLQPGPDGILRSEIFPGLWLDPAALIAGDMQRILQVIQQGVATPEHVAFVARLQQAAQK